MFKSGAVLWKPDPAIVTLSFVELSWMYIEGLPNRAGSNSVSGDVGLLPNGRR
jgi:hypothetical protein